MNAKDFDEKRPNFFDLPCKFLLDSPLKYDSLKVHVNEWTKWNDTCVMSIIDRLADIYIENNDFNALSCLMTICNNSDTRIDNFMIDINGSFFYANFSNFSKYLFYYFKNYNEEHCFVKYLISALSLQIAASGNEDKELEVILKHIDTEAKKNKIDVDVVNYIKDITKRLKPDLWK